VGVDDSQRPPHRGLSLRAKIGVGAFIGVLYAVGMSVRGEVLAGVVGGVLAAILCVLVLRSYEQQRQRHRRGR
jgi:Flp pilus assembly protein TadB